MKTKDRPPYRLADTGNPDVWLVHPRSDQPAVGFVRNTDLGWIGFVNTSPRPVTAKPTDRRTAALMVMNAHRFNLRMADRDRRHH